MTPDQISLLRLIKRSAVILIALLNCDQPTTARQLSSMITIDYATTRNHLKDLAHHGLAYRVTGGYLPSQKATQLVAPKARENRAFETSTPSESAEKPRFPQHKARKNRANAGKPTPLLNTIIIKNHSEDSNNNKQPTETRENRANANKPRSELWETLSLYGILKNHRTQKLETMEHITPDLIKQLADRINKPFPQYAGLLIRALEQSANHPPAHPTGCTCPDCRRKYTSGKYAEFINS